MYYIYIYLECGFKRTKEIYREREREVHSVYVYDIQLYICFEFGGLDGKVYVCLCDWLVGWMHASMYLMITLRR